jgi:hypothetical protein
MRGLSSKPFVCEAFRNKVLVNKMEMMAREAKMEVSRGRSGSLRR